MKITITYEDLKKLVNLVEDTKITDVDWLLTNLTTNVDVIGVSPHYSEKYEKTVVTKDVEDAVLDTTDSKTIYSIADKISVRAFNVIIRKTKEMVENSTNPEVKERLNGCEKYRLSDFYVCTPSLKSIRSCGKRVALEIIDLFKTEGFDTTGWEKELEQKSRRKKTAEVNA